MRYRQCVCSLLLVCSLVGCVGGLPFPPGKQPTATPNPDIQEALEFLSAYGRALEPQGVSFQVGVFSSPIDIKLLKDMLTRGKLMVGIYTQEDDKGTVYFSQVRQPGDELTYIFVTGVIESKQQIVAEHPHAKGKLPSRILDGLPYLSLWVSPQKGSS